MYCQTRQTRKLNIRHSKSRMSIFLITFNFFDSFSQTPIEGFWLQSCTPTVFTSRIGSIVGQENPNMHAMFAPFQPVKKEFDTIPLTTVPSTFPFKYPSFVLVFQITPGSIERYATFASVSQNIAITLAVNGGIERPNRTFSQC